MRRLHPGAAALLLALVLAGAAGRSPATPPVPDEPFPHASHQGLFPLCTACHGGVAAGDSARTFTVDARTCAGCHDGDVMPEVEWTSPVLPALNLKFDHELHVTENGQACADCHQAPDSKNRMEVVLPAPEVCMNCHGSGPHTSEANASDCRTCHDPIAAAPRIPVSAIAAYPRPEDHRAEDFAAVHGKEARSGLDRCAVCHARQSCERCHLGAAPVPAVAELAPDSRFAGLEKGTAYSWPAPPGHDGRPWIYAHGKAAAAGIQRCATCHVRPDCVRCHGAEAPAVVSSLPPARPGTPSGK